MNRKMNGLYVCIYDQFAEVDQVFYNVQIIQKGIWLTISLLLEDDMSS